MLAPIPAAPLRWQGARITDVVRRTPRVTSFFLEPSEPFSFRAGQHVDVRLTAPDGYQARRGYSIASPPEQVGTIELAIEKLDTGEVSPYFHDVAAVGDEIEIRGPLGGHFVWSVEDGGPVLLVGGGSGIAPLMSMARHRAMRGALVPMTLVYSAPTTAEMIFREELLGLRDRHDGFDLVLVLTREPAAAADYTRRVDAAMMADVIGRMQTPPFRAFVCGSNPFVGAASEALLASGMTEHAIRTERYGS